jgi:uncharacterized membrane protein YkvA (DUF1232 family)
MREQAQGTAGILEQVATSSPLSNLAAANRLLTAEWNCFHYPTMKKAKSKRGGARKTHSTVKRTTIPSPRIEPAVRSETFSEAVEDAKSYIRNPERLRGLLTEASVKIASIPREPFKETWAYLQAMLRLLGAYSRGEYRDVPVTALISIIAAIAYVVNPFDLIPDVVPFLGFLDDAAVIAFAVRKTRESLDNFMIWETSNL